MDVVRIPRFLLFPAIAAFAWFAHPAYADTRNFAIVRCDETAGELVVSEEFTEEDVEAYKTPEGFQSKWMDQLVEYISPPGGAPDDAVHGTYRHKTGEWKLRCTLKGAVYNVVISPWSVNDMVMGQCGAGDPDVELTVRRDKRVLVRKLQLGGACSIGPNEPFRIGTVRLFEPEKVATLDDRRIPYSDMPLLNQEKAQNLDKYPIVRSSTVTATPSIASNGYKCNETGSQQEMNACAELNFNAEDNELNKVYKTLKASLTPTEQSMLVQDERKWLKSRDAKCRKSANDQAEGGSMWPLEFWQCKADTTKIRVEDLRHWKP